MTAGRPAGGYPLISPAEPDELTAALRLAFRHFDPETRLARVAGGLELIDRGELDPAGVLVARAGGRLVGAMVVAPVPGAGAAVWPPQVEPDAPAADVLAGELVARAADWLRGRGVKLAQALLAPEDAALAGPLLCGGFRHVTSLWYLRHDLEMPAGLLGEPERLTYTTLAAAGEATFAAVLARTYEGTHDCPEISDARSPAEALAGHQAGGFDPERWWLASAGGEPAGLLLLNPSPDGDGWEVAYVGVVPEHRRRGYGRELVVKGLVEAKAAGQPGVTLAVDARNRPARELYRRLGFEAAESREVLLAVWAG
ncbi:MAG TPA: GNAT family N-acetyltransferase [Gemmataceae bacterium]|jgi:ribosomal protein S18 acetylase RimI-like enzyme